MTFIRFCNINPNKQLHSLPKQGGVDVLLQSQNRIYLIYVCGDTCTLGVKLVSKLIENIPILNQNNHTNNIKTALKKSKDKKKQQCEEEDEDFFSGLSK